MKLKGYLSPIGTLSGELSSIRTLSAFLTGGISKVEPLPYYEGEYEITPASEAQIIETAQMSMAQNLIVNPIPSNYGLITWDGRTITVS